MLRIGIAGCGSIARLRHAPEYASNPDVSIAGFFGSDRKRAEEMAVRFGGKMYESYKEMISDDSIDAVSICTANHLHACMSVDALKSGKHVLCEKPMAVRAEEGERMLAAARETGKILMIAHNQRFEFAHRKAKSILESGELGKVLSFRMAFSHRGPEYWSAKKSPDTWFFKKDSAGLGAIGDIGVHKADLIRWLLGEEIQEVKAYVTTMDKRAPEGGLIELDDNAVCLMKTGSGITGALFLSWTNYGEMDNSTVIYCSQGVLKVYEDSEFPVTVIKKNGEKVGYKDGYNPAEKGAARSGVIDSFVSCVSAGTAPEIPGTDGLAALKIVQACVESAHRGVAVKV